MPLHPNVHIGAELGDVDERPNEAHVALWTEFAVAVRDLAREERFGPINLAFSGWGYTDEDEGTTAEPRQRPSQQAAERRAAR